MSSATTQRAVPWTRNVGVLLKSVMRYSKYQVKSARIRFPKLVECNVCQWQGKHFLSDPWHKHSMCPKCRSNIRHRLLFAAFQYSPQFSLERIIRGRRVLHFAPEPVVQKLLRGQAARYITADYLNPRRDLQLDISDMHSIRDGEFDAVIACDVLEHVENDRRAMHEIARVLSPGGCAILTVPQKDDLPQTFEDPTVTSAEERTRVFGQWDHLRIYGDDFAAQLELAGLRTTPISEKDFDDSLVERHTLFPPELSEHPLATNYRKVFFGVKPE